MSEVRRRAILDRLRAGGHPSSMVDRTGRLTLGLLSWVLSSVDFAQRCVDSLRDAQERGTVVHVMRNRSLLDYLYFNVAFRQHGLKLVRFANGLNTWLIRPIFRGLRSLLFGRRGLPADPLCLRLLAEANESTLLFLRRSRRSEAQERSEALPFLESLVRQQTHQERPILLVPQLLIWEKRPDRARPTLLDGVFGTRQSPGFFKKALYVIQNFWQAFLHLGAPTVQISSAINLRTFIKERPDTPPSALALEIHDLLNDALEREQRVIVGPWVKRARQVADEILADPRTRTEMTRLEITLETERTELIEKSRRVLREITADFSLLAIKFFSAVLTPIWNQIYSGFEIDHDGLDRLRRTATEHRIVLVPSHKSHIDYLVLSYVFYQNGLIPPHIAAGVNLSFWPMGPLFRRSGAFFLRRSFADDPLYRVLFNAYLVKLLEEGFAIEFFIEGTRSRTGKLNAPRYGMLNMLVEAFRSGNVDSLAFVPVSVGYEKIIEGSSYQKELEGHEKKSEGLGDLLRAPAVLKSRYGRVYVEFGEPIDLNGFLDRYHEPGEEPAEANLARTVRRLAYGIIHGINDVTTVTPSALVSLLLLNHTARAIDRPTLTRQAGFVLAMLRERNARLSRTLRDALEARYTHLRPAPSALQDQRSDLDDYDQAFLRHSGDWPTISAGSTPAEPDALSDDAALGEAIQPTLEEALALLADDRLVTTRNVDGQTFWSAPDDRRPELSYYKNNIIHFFVPEAVFATGLAMVETPGPDAAVAADADSPDGHEPTRQEIDVETLRERVQFLSRLLKYEYCFEERSRFDEVFQRTLHWFRDRGWVTVSGDSLLPTSATPPAGQEFLRGLLLPTLESYRLAAETLIDRGEEWMDARGLTRLAIQRGRSGLLRGDLEHPESLAKPTIEAAYRIFREWELAATRSTTRGRRSVRELRVGSPEAREGLETFVRELRATSKRQQRQADAPLREA